jgi:hypothetical protein
MARVNLNQTNFTAGELSPRLYGRVDIARYTNGAKVLRNGYVLTHGGFVRRPGTKFGAPARFPGKKVRMVRYVFNTSQAYVLELGDQYLRIWKDGGQVLDLVRSISGATQANPCVLTITAHGFTTGDDVFLTGVAGMTDLNGRFCRVTVLSANTVSLQNYDGSNVDSTSFAAYTSDGTAGRIYTLSTSYTEQQVQELDYAQSADSMFIAHPSQTPRRLQRFGDASWVLSTLPYVNEPTDERGHRVTSGSATLSDASVGAGRTITITPAAFLAADIGRLVVGDAGGAATITAVGGTTATLTITQAFPSTTLAAGTWRILNSPLSTVTPSADGPIGATITLTAGSDTWRDVAGCSDVGSVVRINGGVARITSVSSATVASAVIIIALSGTTEAPADAWVLEQPTWNAFDGYPRTVTLYEQRLLFAGTAGQPQTIWGSYTGEVFNFARGTADNEGFAFTIASDEVNPILYLSSVRTLIALTYGGEFTLHGGIEKPITPTNVQVRSRSNHGCSAVRPLRIKDEEIFVQRAGRRLRAFSYNATNDRYESLDISLLSEHLFSVPIIDMCWQQEPEPVIWVVRLDGRLLAGTLDRDQDVIAWTLVDTEAGASSFESVASIPSSAGETVYAAVRREANGASYRYIEILDPVRNTDSAVVGNADDQTVFGGLWHLNSRTVQVVANGAYRGTYEVTDGRITLERAATGSYEIGLGYSTRVEMLEPELSGGEGSAQGAAMRTGQVYLRLLNTIGGQVNDQDLPTLFEGADALDSGPRVVTGLVRVDVAGWERGETPLIIEQVLPFPFHLQAVIRKVSINWG